MNAPPEIREAAGNLGRSLAQLAESTAAYVGGRVEEADNALRAEQRRWLWMALSAGAALLWLGAATLFAGFAIIAACWDSHRVLATTAVAAGFLLLAAVAGWMFWRNAHRRAPAAARVAGWLALAIEVRRLLR